jgi:2-polyprenyl-3-methyl-5-hydroxy-6-metoxy-1,4-benzoquinol methylase
MQIDKAGKAYWDEVWVDGPLPLPINPKETHLDNYVNVRFHEFFSSLFSKTGSRGKLLLEVGCAKSAWLPYFSQQFGFRVSGLDYSETGCRQSEEILSNAGVQGEIVCADFFAPPASLIGRFDVLVTFGVVEHFADTRSCIEALLRFLKPGGLLVTIIPNMTGWIGTIQKQVNRPVYDIHVPLDARSLMKVHQPVRVKVLSCQYFLFTNFGVPNLNGLDPRSPGWKIKNIFLKILFHMSKLTWWWESAFRHLPPNRWTSPYIHCVAQKERE